MANLSRAEARIRRHNRVRKHLSGTPARPRLAIYRSEAEIYAQVIDDEAGRTVAAASSIDHELREKIKGMTKTEQARAVGQLVAERAKGQGITQVVFDRGGFQYMGRVKALADGARQAGLDF